MIVKILSRNYLRREYPRNILIGKMKNLIEQSLEITSAGSTHGTLSVHPDHRLLSPSRNYLRREYPRNIKLYELWAAKAEVSRNYLRREYPRNLSVRGLLNGALESRNYLRREYPRNKCCEICYCNIYSSRNYLRREYPRNSRKHGFKALCVVSKLPPQGVPTEHPKKSN